MNQATEVLAVNDIAELLRGFELSLRARNRSPKTIKGYREAAELFREFLVRVGMPTEVDRITREHVEAFIADQLERWKPTTAQVRYGGPRQFFKWAVEDGEIKISPMANMGPPTIPEVPVPVPVVSDDDLKKLLKACEGNSFEQLRDTAILRVFIDCGARLAEVTGLRVEDVDLDLKVILVVGKGKRPRAVPFGVRTAKAIEKYLRYRARHAQAALPDLWIGSKGRLTDSGVAQMLRRRCKDAGLEQLHPHQLRHTAAHNWLAMGGNEGDAMRLFGWRPARCSAGTGRAPQTIGPGTPITDSLLATGSEVTEGRSVARTLAVVRPLCRTMTTNTSPGSRPTSRSIPMPSALSRAFWNA
ncbi:MAG: tyrosine-type recombinase/integrase [Acidimicrobiales bacterium]